MARKLLLRMYFPSPLATPSCTWVLSLWLLLASTSASSARALPAGPAHLSPQAHPDPAQFVQPFTYRGQQVPRLRAPAKLADRGGYALVSAAEQLLQRAHQALLADSLQPVLPPADDARLPVVLAQVRAAWPWWGTSYYEQEAAFYRAENQWRAQRRQVLALQAQLRRQRAARTADSLAQRRAALVRDSLALAAQQTRAADSLATSTAATVPARRYVNTSQLKLRAAPSTSAPVQAALLAGSAVQVLDEDPASTGWVRVAVEEQEGYLLAEYLVASLTDITVADADLVALQAGDGNAYFAEPATAAATAPARRAAARPTAARRVYVCNGQYAYSYHASDYCPGLNNCRASVSALKEGAACQLGRVPCHRCFR